jgi:hypothetical protein
VGEEPKRFEIWIGDYQQHTVRATDGASAVKKWLEDQGYDTLDQAAKEYDLSGSDIVAAEVKGG